MICPISNFPLSVTLNSFDCKNSVFSLFCSLSNLYLFISSINSLTKETNKTKIIGIKAIEEATGVIILKQLKIAVTKKYTFANL